MPHMQQVKASAGSGKTYEITQQFLGFLAQSTVQPHVAHCSLGSGTTSLPQGYTAAVSWGDIMAITFTNMATLEMKHRVLKSLKEIALGTATSPQKELMPAATAKAWIDIILRQYSALNIRTIDSLLHLVVRTAALDMGFSPDFETSFHVEEIMAPIYDAFLEEANQAGAGMDASSSSLFLLETICNSLLHHEDAQGFSIGAKIEASVTPLVELLLTQDLPPLSPIEEVKTKAQHIHSNFNGSACAMLELITQEGLSVNAHALRFIERCAQGDQKALKSVYMQRACLDDILNKKSQGQASDLAERTFLQFLEFAHEMLAKGKLLYNALQLHPFLALARLLTGQIQLMQKQDGKVPHATINKLAHEVLEFEHGVSAALCRIGNSVYHVLLDEFQDTSREQWEALRPLMVEALSRGGSLSWVGDVKQAIYGWRGGDASLFDEVCHTQELTCMATPTRKALPKNWRSKEHIVRTNNMLFAPLADAEAARALLLSLMSDDCPERILQENVQKLTAAYVGVEQEWRDDADGGYVCIEQVGDADCLTAELNEAVCEHLHRRLEEDIRPRYAWSEVAILVRKKEHAALVATWLLQWQIPAITENSLLLHAHPLVGESLALLSFLHSPQDDLHFWAVLTGSIVRPALRDATCADEVEKLLRPSLQELHAWRVTQDNAAKKIPLYAAFKQQWPLFWEHVFAPFYGTANILSPYDCMQEWYRLWQVPKRFHEAQTFVRRFLEILFSAEEKGAGTLGTFLELWEKEGDKEKTPMPSNINAVHILTIHKSKGLQFPVVIVPWMSFNNKDDTDIIVHEVDGLRMLAKRGSYSGDDYYVAQAKSALESLNVLYVACTRAEEELYLFHTVAKHHGRRNYLTQALELLFARLDICLPYEVGRHKAVINAMSQTPQEQEILDIFSDSASNSLCEENMSQAFTQEFTQESTQESKRLMDWLPWLKIYREPLQNLVVAPSSAAQGQGLTPKQRGLLTHHCMETLQKMGIFPKTGALVSDVWSSDLDDTVRMAVRLGIQSFALSVHPNEELVQDLVTALTWYITLPGMSMWLEKAVPEQSLVDVPQEKGEKIKANPLYRVDLLLPPQGQGRGYRLIEFKTGQVAEEHLVQVRHYMRILDALPTSQQAALPESEAMLVYLDLQKCRMVQRQTHSELLAAPAWQGGD